MNSTTEIVRTIQVEGKTITLHIHLSKDEVRRLLLPHVASAFALELRRLNMGIPVTTSGNSTTALSGKGI